MAGPGEGPLLRRPQPGRRHQACRLRPLRRRRRRTRAGCRARRPRRLGPHRARRTRPPAATRSPTASTRTSNCSPMSRPSTTASRSARRAPPTCRWPPTISATSPAASAPRKARLAELDNDTVAYHFKEPMGVVGQIIPVELPAADGGVEARAGAGHRQLRGDQARLRHAAEPGRADGPDRRRAARRRAERGVRAWLGSRRAARVQSAHRQGQLHRRDDHRPADHAVRGREPDPQHHGTRRQVAEHLHGRRDGRGRRVPRQGAGRLRAVRVQQGRGLHLPVARAGAGIDLRQVHGEGGRAGRQDQDGRSARSRPR